MTTLTKKFAIARIQYQQHFDTEIWPDRFDTEQDALDWMVHYFSHDYREFVVLTVYIIDPGA